MKNVQDLKDHFKTCGQVSPSYLFTPSTPELSQFNRDSHPMARSFVLTCSRVRTAGPKSC